MCSSTSSSISIVAETAFNHEGDYDYLIELVNLAAASNVTHIKFQVLINVDEFVSQSSEAYELVKSWCFTQEQWLQVFDYAESLNLKLFIMPLDTKAVQLCHRSTIDFIEIHSVSFNDECLLNSILTQLPGKTIALGIGGRTINELKHLNEVFYEHQLLLMCGFQAFPSKLEDVKIARLKYLSSIFPEATLGYADHSAPELNDAIYSSHYAHGLGARVFEKHISLDVGRTDSQSALNEFQLKNYVFQLKRYIKIVSETEDSSFKMNKNELVYRSRQKKVVAKEDIKIGDKFCFKNIGLKMHSDDSDFFQLAPLFGIKSSIDIRKGQVVCIKK